MTTIVEDFMREVSAARPPRIWVMSKSREFIEIILRLNPNIIFADSFLAFRFESLKQQTTSGIKF
jgi:hypothetical protein